MSDEKKGQDARLKFYTSSATIRYIKTVGVPKRTGEFRAMVASGSTVKLDSKEGADLITTLGRVVFARHPQQINITDDTNGKMISSIAI
ncbi:MAG TPA: hypothetical protein VFB30_12100 [Spirochaetia bacterium]|nr:hypothetical protein [Spirochaetia bacterium]